MVQSGTLFQIKFMTRLMKNIIVQHNNAIADDNYEIIMLFVGSDTSETE